MTTLNLIRRKLAPIIATVVLALLVMSCDDDDPIAPTNPADMPYNVEVNPDDFETENIVGNAFFPLITGKVYIYEGEDDEGTAVRIEEIFTDQTKVILGVTCVIVNFKEYEDGELIEDTFDWYAQDKHGNVWYFGEDSKDLEGGEIVSTSGSWEAGVAGALPGVLMFANPIPGTWYRQEYYKGEAEDVGQVLSLNASISVPYGQFSNCLQVAEWSLLEPGIVEHKYYSPGLGLVHVVKVEGETGYESLIEVK